MPWRERLACAVWRRRERGERQAPSHSETPASSLEGHEQGAAPGVGVVRAK